MSFVARLLWLAVFLCLPGGIDLVDSEVALLQMRKAFLQAEHYIRQHRDEDYLVVAESLKDYVLYPYLQYQWLSEHLHDDTSVQQFLHDYAQSRYASLLHDKWLRHLGQVGDWSNLLRHYKASDDETLQCFWLLALFNQQQRLVAEPMARELWSTGKNLPAVCESGLIQVAPDIFQVDRGLLWQRFRNALLRDNHSVSNELMARMTDDERHRAQWWVRLHQQPQNVAEAADWKQNDPDAGVLFAHAIERWLDHQPLEALRVWDDEQASFVMPPARRAELEKALAIALALRRDARAYDRLTALASQDAISREWRVRAALYMQDWAKVLAAIDSLEATQRQQDKWLYWQARALSASGQKDAARDVLLKLSHERSLYGFLAAYRMGVAIDWRDKPQQVDNHALAMLLQRDDFQAFAELKALQRVAEAKRQWRYAISKLAPEELVLAAKLAQYWQAPALAISTIAKAGVWDDLDLRYPLHHLDAVQRQATQKRIEPALILGLIRQESAFDATAESGAGAKGLMQLMPATAREVAEQENIDWSEHNLLFEPSLNIQLGSAYFGTLLQRFDGHYLPAIASYNAGPNRVKHWWSQEQSLPGDIWMEIIPYKETRAYVAAVMGNSLIYQWRLSPEGQIASDLLRELQTDEN